MKLLTSFPYHELHRQGQLISVAMRLLRKVILIYKPTPVARSGKRSSTSSELAVDALLAKALSDESSNKGSATAPE